MLDAAAATDLKLGDSNVLRRHSIGGGRGGEMIADGGDGGMPLTAGGGRQDIIFDDHMDDDIACISDGFWDGFACEKSAADMTEDVVI